MNSLKGSINLANEIIDNMKNTDDLRSEEGQTLFDILKALKEMQGKLEELITSTENEDVLNICLAVNDDMLKTFDRFRALRNGGRPEPFIPIESTNHSLVMLEPSYIYGSDKAG
jgi:hypothetical protein